MATGRATRIARVRPLNAPCTTTDERWGGLDIALARIGIGVLGCIEGAATAARSTYPPYTARAAAFGCAGGPVLVEVRITRARSNDLGVVL